MQAMSFNSLKLCASMAFLFLTVINKEIVHFIAIKLVINKLCGAWPYFGHCHHNFLLLEGTDLWYF
jgi:hypothetical protein